VSLGTTGGIFDLANLTVTGGLGDDVGSDVAFADVRGEGRDLLIVGASGGGGIADGALYAVDPDRIGTVATVDADLALSGPMGFGNRFAMPDLDGDGLVDLVPTGAFGAEVRFFQGPWTTTTTGNDAVGMWTAPDPTFELGLPVEAIGDITGDGLEDVAFSAPIWGDEPYRVGRVYVAAGSIDSLRFGPADDLPIQVQGATEGEGVGFGLAGADVDGDGQQDLVVGATGVWPGWIPGAVLVFPGPVDGIHPSADAPIAVYGEYPGDLFGRAIISVDVDGDARADLVIGAPGWPANAQQGAVYLITGAALVP
jgi:hypothetical protein